MVLLVVSPSLAVAATPADPQAFAKAIDRMMLSLARQSARDSAAVKKEYRPIMDLLVLDAYVSLTGALATGGLVPLPPEPARFNLKPRVDGPSPIGEKDLENQSSYLAARPETIGALIEVASRVRSGAVEITSLVRHLEYQEELKTTNGNANTSVPTHTMGLAFDIALVNTPLRTVYEIRDVLHQMQAAGDLLVIGERKQLVFHVVPQPARLGHFMDVYAQAMAAATPDANIIALPTVADALAPLKPTVTAEIAAIRPVDELSTEWWAAANVESNLTVAVSSPTVTPAPEPPSFVERCVALVGGLFARFRAIVT
jgi:Family of unknown function (DUF5715)